MTADRPRRIGPGLWSHRYRFEEIGIRNLSTGRVRRISGVLELEVAARAGGPRVRYAAVHSDGLPPTDPFGI